MVHGPATREQVREQVGGLYTLVGAIAREKAGNRHTHRVFIISGPNGHRRVRC